MAEKAQLESDNQSAVTLQQVETRHDSHRYNGNGTIEDPFVVEFMANDPHNPMNFSNARKWFITSIVTLAVFAITLTSSAYSGSAEQIIKEFDTSDELFALGISLFVLGFAIGPALWAPLSELYGRQILFVSTLACITAFVGASAGCKNMASLLVLRFLAGMFGASTLTNSGGVIADLFPPAERGIAMALFGSAPFMGPVMGPMLGGFVSITIGWRWVQAICCIFIGLVWISGLIFMPETYGPVLLQRTAARLSSHHSSKTYTSVLELNLGTKTPSAIFAKALQRPWVLLFAEPIVLIASTYLAILYGTIYMFMGAFPIVYQTDRGWNAGISGLAFLGLALGMLAGLVYTILDNGRYARLAAAGTATPESRLPPCMIGALALPIGMFAFAWTNAPSAPWAASITLSAPFGFGSVLVFMSCLNYLMDAYTIYAASVLAAGAILRSLFGAAFPLFTSQMYARLGIHWASSVPAFLTVLCLPFPFVMWRWGAGVRGRCRYAAEAAVLLERMREVAPGGGSGSGSGDEDEDDAAV